MARILINISSQPAGRQAGVFRYATRLASELIADGRHEIRLRTQWSEAELAALMPAAAHVDTIPPVHAYLIEVVRSSLSAPIVYPATEVDLLLNIDPLGMWAGGRKRVTIVHDIYFKSLPSHFSVKDRLKAQLIHLAVLRRSDAIVAISETTANDLRHHYPSLADRVSIILSDSTLRGISAAPLRDEVEANRYILAVANVTPNKNFGLLASAFGRIASQNPGIRLVHVGDDSQEIFSKELARHSAIDRLVRLKNIPDDQLVALYEHALCLCVPSLYEGFCLPIVEAQALGCPVVFSAASASGEIGGQGGIRFDPHDERALAACLHEVINQPEKRLAMKRDGHENAKRFSWRRAAQQYSELFDNLLQSPA